MHRLSLCALVVFSLAVVACNREEPEEMVDRVRELSEASPGRLAEPGRRGTISWNETQAFYRHRQYRPAWSADRRPSEAFDQLLEALTHADAHGFDPNSYATPMLATARRIADEQWWGPRFARDQVAEIDVLATYAFLRLAADLRYGRTLPREVDAKWTPARRTTDLVMTLRDALAQNRVGDALAELAPTHPQYAGLQKALNEYRLAVSVVAQQPRGDAMPRWRVQQIEMNLERWRWLPRDLGSRYVMVNVPAYELQVIERDESVLAMRVIVGAPDSPTPLFSDEMTYVVFSPFWNIPESIMREETAPRVVENPDYLAQAGIEVVRTHEARGEPVDPADVDWSTDLASQGLRLRQVPGPDNALGLVKFVFPNHFNVYLHDTPTDRLFERAERALSHGCIRVEQPTTLAEYVLGDLPAWTPERIATAMHTREETVVKLRTPLPVHLGYWTTWVQPDGSIRFTDDPYRVDRRQATSWNRGKARPKPSVRSSVMRLTTSGRPAGNN
jgi:murein L,D-transpeptidase YcbB/YkuD